MLPLLQRWRQRRMFSRIAGGAAVVLIGTVIAVVISRSEGDDPPIPVLPLAEQGPGIPVEPAGPDHVPADIDYMLRGYFLAYSLDDGEPVESGGWYADDNYYREIPESATFAPDQLVLVVRADLATPFNAAISGIPVYLANRTDDTRYFFAQDSRLPIVVEAIDSDGQWRPIEYLPSSWCGNSYHDLSLPEDTYWSFVTPRYTGSIPTRMRLFLQMMKSDDHEAVDTLYSNEWEGSVNPGQFVQKEGHEGTNIMDPYDE